MIAKRIKEGQYGYCPVCGSGFMWKAGTQAWGTKVRKSAQRYRCQSCNRVTFTPKFFRP